MAGLRSQSRQVRNQAWHPGLPTRAEGLDLCSILGTHCSLEDEV